MMMSGKGLVQKGADFDSHPGVDLNSSSPIYRQQNVPAEVNNRVDMVDSYFAVGITSAAVTSVEHPGLDIGKRAPLTGSAGRSKAKVVSVEEAESNDNDQELDNGMLTTRSIAPPEMPGISIITWDEFIEDPAMFYRLFSLDKNEFIHFDPSIVTNFFHDSRMDPPVLGGPSGDGMSWTIYVDSYNQLQQVRSTLTSKISVLLVDLVNPKGGGTAACLLAINPHNDHIRRVLHLTLSRAMQTMMADRCFSIEIDLNQSVAGWSKKVLQSDCAVKGGRILITNGDAPDPCCEVDDPKFCVLCFPVWAFRRIRYVIQRRRHYDDILLEFESSSIVLCTKSDKLRKSAEAAQLMNGGKVLNQNKRAVTMATQTLNTSTASLQSDMSVEDVPDDVMVDDDNEEGDNDVFDDVTHDERGGFTPAPPPLEEDKIIDEQKPSRAGCSVISSSISLKNDALYDTHHSPRQTLDSGVGGITNFAFVSDADNQPDKQEKPFSKRDIPDVFKPVDKKPDETNKPSALKDSTRNEGNKKKMKSVMFQQSLTIEYPADTSDSAVKLTGHSNISTKNQTPVKIFNSRDTEQLPSPRSAFLQRPDTPYQPKSKPSHMTPIKAIHDLNTVSKINIPVSKDNERKETMPGKPAFPWIGRANTGNTRNNDGINDKIANRQRKIGLLLKDLVMSSSIIPRGKPKFLDNDVFNDEESDERLGARNTMFATSNFKPSSSRTDTATKKVMHSPVEQQKDTVFPYTSDLLSFPTLSPSTTADDLERYGAQTKKKKGKSNNTSVDDDDNLLFKPRHTMLNLDAFGPDRNCFSDQDVNDSDITDLETEPESAISDTEGITSSRLIPVVKTERTVSIDAVNGSLVKPTELNNTGNSDVDTDLEVTDCEAEEEALAQKLRAPRILPGAQAAHAMNASRAASAKSRDYIPPNAQPRRRGGSQNDSRRRYLALNSLRRKAYELKQNAKTKPPSPKPLHKAQLLSYNARNMPQATIMSQV